MRGAAGRSLAALRAGCLLGAATYAGLHLLLWLSAAPTALTSLAKKGAPPGEAAEITLVLTGLGLLGAAATWWPLRAWKQATRRDALRCALLALAYLAFTVPAWMRGVGMPAPDAAWHQHILQIGALLMAAATLLLILSGGLIEDPGTLAIFYAAALLLGAGLTWIRPSPAPAP